MLNSKRGLCVLVAIIASGPLALIAVQAQQVVVTHAYAVRSGEIQKVAEELRAALKDNAKVTLDFENGQLLVAAENHVHEELRRALSAKVSQQASPAAPLAQPKTDNAFLLTEPASAAADAMILPSPTNAPIPPQTPLADDRLQLAQAPVEIPAGPVDLPLETAPQREVLRGPTTPSQTGGAATPTASQETLSLKHVSPQRVIQTVQRLLKKSARTTTQGNRTTISAVGQDGQPVRFEIDNTTGRVDVRGTAATRKAWQRVLTAVDRPTNTQTDRTQLVSVTGSRPAAIQRALKLIREQNDVSLVRESPPRKPVIQWQSGRRVPAATQLAQNAGAAPPATAGGQTKGLIGDVQIVYLEGLDVIVLRGNPQDVERVQGIIDEIENLSTVTEPVIDVYELKHANSQAMADLVNPLYEEVISPRQGPVSITPLVQPNSILLVGRGDSVRVARELVEKLDKPTTPDSQFHVFQLKNMNAAEAEATITSFYEERGGLGTRVRVTSDGRSNSVIVQAGPRDAEEVNQLISRMDVKASARKESMRVFKLRFSLAEELAPILQEALLGQDAAALGGGVDGEQSEAATALSLLTTDAKGQQLIKSGVLADVSVTAETQSNAIIARGPESSMPLIEALIKQLDELPSEDAEVKVFTIDNGDAVLLAQVLNQLFGTTTAGAGAGAGGFGGGANQNQNSGGQNPLIPLRFSVDERTNSIVATGSLQDLRVVEAILLRLDEEGISNRRTEVYRLRYAPAVDVATAVNDFLLSERSITDAAPNTITQFQLLDREIIVVPEPVSNSLIISATPRYFDQISQIVRKLDERPPMVMMQLLIAEVELQHFAELGLELGFQDAVLFDRGAVDVDGNVTPGFNFNNQSLGNNGVNPGTVAGQALTSFALDRINDQFGFGGLVLSASSESVSFLLRALELENRVQILSRPQIMTVDNQPAYVQIGSRVPRIESTQLTQFGTINNTILEDVGIVFGVTPRISPDGLVVMEIDAEKSELGDAEDGIPIAISESGDIIFSPIINTKTAVATIAARNGQTVVFGGLISETDNVTERGVPYLSDIPLIGDLFTFDRHDRRRTELLFILTPYIIRGDQDINCINQMETERMTWCLSDAYRVHGYFDVNSCDGTLGLEGANGITEIYPDETPSAIDFSTVEQSNVPNSLTRELYQPPYGNGSGLIGSPQGRSLGLPSGNNIAPSSNAPYIIQAPGTSLPTPSGSPSVNSGARTMPSNGPPTVPSVGQRAVSFPPPSESTNGVRQVAANLPLTSTDRLGRNVSVTPPPRSGAERIGSYLPNPVIQRSP